MKIRPLRAVLICLLSLSFIVPARAWPPPCPDCYYWDGDSCENEGDCVDDGDCESCEDCVDCYCEMEEGAECVDWEDCGDQDNCCDCIDCDCEDEDEWCDGCCECDDCGCEDYDRNCSSINCEDCSSCNCEDRCPALDKHCWLGTCVECIDVLDCELCYECINHECVHPCDECYYPKYCGYACACVECYPGTDDTTTCSGVDSDTCTGCTSWPISPCSGGEKVVYTHNSLTTCTGPNCETSDDVLCYTTYECEAGEWIPFLWCKYNVPGPNACGFDIEHPIGPGCWPCAIDEESADPTYETRGVCPVEAWP